MTVDRDLFRQVAGSFASGVTVVTTGLGGATEVIDRTCGVLLDGPDPAGLEAALRQLIEDPDSRRTLAEAAPKQAARFCDRKRQVAQLWSALAGVRESSPA